MTSLVDIVNKHYYPLPGDKIVWSSNRNTPTMVTWQGITAQMRDWARAMDISFMAMRNRLANMSLENAMDVNIKTKWDYSHKMKEKIVGNWRDRPFILDEPKSLI